jgi:hypothetical protein
VFREKQTWCFVKFESIRHKTKLRKDTLQSVFFVEGGFAGVVEGAEEIKQEGPLSPSFDPGHLGIVEWSVAERQLFILQSKLGGLSLAGFT